MGRLIPTTDSPTDWPIEVAEDRQRRLMLQMDGARLLSPATAAHCQRTRLIGSESLLQRRKEGVLQIRTCMMVLRLRRYPIAVTDICRSALRRRPAVGALISLVRPCLFEALPHPSVWFTIWRFYFVLYLLCLYLCNQFACDRIYVCNPVTGEYTTLPGATTTRTTYLDGFHGMGFGYDFARKEYKVVRLVCQSRPPYTWEAEIYTLGTDSWRSITDFPGQLCASFPFSDVLVNGALHWKAEESHF